MIIDPLTLKVILGDFHALIAKQEDIVAPEGADWFWDLNCEHLPLDVNKNFSSSDIMFELFTDTGAPYSTGLNPYISVSRHAGSISTLRVHLSPPIQHDMVQHGYLFYRVRTPLPVDHGQVVEYSTILWGVLRMSGLLMPPHYTTANHHPFTSSAAFCPRVVINQALSIAGTGPF